ncbi:hypothetical protein [Caldalkalibacillus mannanilyticus]|uniref:hypothetical protein n=1 Tax=Caldalkalibacillus mannanilyticus TaxID=1418 RepID=UPI00131EECAB|nr:hypothetical protein [Caldalkalibacillus mannanilyticus]
MKSFKLNHTLTPPSNGHMKGRSLLSIMEFIQGNQTEQQLRQKLTYIEQKKQQLNR